MEGGGAGPPDEKCVKRIITQVHVYYGSPHNEHMKGCNNMAVCTDQVTKSQGHQPKG